MTEMISCMAQKMAAIHDGYREINETLSELMTKLGREGDRDAAVLAGKLAAQLDVLGQRIEHFRVPGIEDRPTDRAGVRADAVVAAR